MAKTEKKRLDQLVVERGLADSRSKAQALIMAGEIRVNGKTSPKAGRLVPIDADIELKTTGPRYVSRGGKKLDGALAHFDINPSGCLCLDVGASTGGFTDCLLKHGATHVFTVDVGKGQLDLHLRTDPRVTWRESFNARNLTPDHLPFLVDLAVVDVSFISLKKILPQVINCVREGGIILALIKPQFEGTRRDVMGSGVVRDELRRQQILKEIRKYVEAELGLQEVDVTDTVLPGAKGNREAFLVAVVPAPLVA